MDFEAFLTIIKMFIDKLFELLINFVGACAPTMNSSAIPASAMSAKGIMVAQQR